MLPANLSVTDETFETEEILRVFCAGDQVRAEESFADAR
jgi:hypothetical protein